MAKISKIIQCHQSSENVGGVMAKNGGGVNVANRQWRNIESNNQRSVKIISA
jgi:hypothetical protein